MAITVTHIKQEHRDTRGAIAHVVDQTKFKLRAVLRITSKAGAIRSNHYHKKDAHYMYLEIGKCEYFEKPAHKKNARVEKVILKPGDLVLTKPNIIHAVRFLEDSVLYAFPTEKRKQESYEEDTVRVTIVK